MNEYKGRDLDTHVKVLAWLYMVSSTLLLLMGLLGLLFFAGIGLFSSIAGPDPVPLAVMTLMGILGLVFFGLLSLPGLAAGYGLLKHKSWGRILALVVAVFKLLDFPLGTTVAIYAFWVLTPEDAGIYFTEPKAA